MCVVIRKRYTYVPYSVVYNKRFNLKHNFVTLLNDIINVKTLSI